MRAPRRQVFAPREFFPQFGRLWIIVRGAACRQGIVMAPGGVSAPDDAASSLRNGERTLVQFMQIGRAYHYCSILIKVDENRCIFSKLIDRFQVR